MIQSIIIIWCIIQLCLIVGLYYYYSNLVEYRCVCEKYNVTFPLAKASAFLINISSFLSLMSIVRLPKLYVYIPFKLKYMHICFSVSLCVWSIVHVVCHYIKFIRFEYGLFTSSIGISGNILVLLLVMVIILSASRIRKLYYQVFLYFHYVFMVSYSVVLFVHGNLCFIKNDYGVCPGSTSWIWLLLPLIYVCGCTIYKFMKRVEVINVLNCGNDIIELKLRLPYGYGGKTVWLCCPNISYLEWHPFTVAIYRDGECYIYYKMRGDWTRKFYEILKKVYIKDIKILVEGPYYALPKDILNRISKMQVVLISSGIGVTPFANVFQRLIEEDILIYSLHIILIVRHEEEIGWLLPIIKQIYNKKNINMMLFVTGKKINALDYMEVVYSMCRPNFNDILMYNKVKDERTDVYYSGRSKLGMEIRRICDKVRNYCFCDVN